MRPDVLCIDASDSRRRVEGESTSVISGVDSMEGALPVEHWREPFFRLLVALLSSEILGKLSPPVVSLFAVDVIPGSIETTDLIGKTRSVAEGLKGPEGESKESDMGEPMPCMLGFHGVERGSWEPHRA